MNNVIDGDFTGKKKPAFAVKRQSDTVYCAHQQVEIDNHKRILCCTKCGEVLDAFGYLYKLATKETRLFDDIKRLQQDVQDLTMQRDALKKQVSRLKSEYKKAMPVHKDPVSKPSVLGLSDRQSCLSQIKQKLADKP